MIASQHYPSLCTPMSNWSARFFIISLPYLFPKHDLELFTILSQTSKSLRYPPLLLFNLFPNSNPYLSRFFLSTVGHARALHTFTQTYTTSSPASPERSTSEQRKRCEVPSIATTPTVAAGVNVVYQWSRALGRSVDKLTWLAASTCSDLSSVC